MGILKINFKSENMIIIHNQVWYFLIFRALNLRDFRECGIAEGKINYIVAFKLKDLQYGKANDNLKHSYSWKSHLTANVCKCCIW